MATPHPGQGVSMMNERRRAQNRLAQRRHRQRQALEKQAAHDEQSPAVHTGTMQPGFQTGSGLPLPLSDETASLNAIDSLPPFPGSDMALLGFSPPWDDSVSTLAESHAPLISSTGLLCSADAAHLTLPPSPWILEAPEAARLAAAAFPRNVVPRPNPTFSNNRNEPLIHTAARGNDVATLQLLTQAGSELTERDLEGRTALHAAYEENQMEAILWLLERGVDVNAVDRQGRTTLSMAVNNKCPVGVKLMLSHGANPLRTQTEQIWALSMSNGNL
ncbi:ankyrin repeat-containing domain protein [Dactylonectria macrodidyma]|uniref:Ankyrin repeat-containing domain protein n=1 Tax=Dactylonectria macrodidyma TaxID=307937 RepID=A0A9P9IVF3_9HYPO|nr:ankyrin repeat-containing domain protein [Dactylonectria macrodidyma]